MLDQGVLFGIKEPERVLDDVAIDGPAQYAPADPLIP